jgi:hypothetical protein
MKIKKEDLERIIEEELNEIGLYHSPKTGRWVSKSAGAVKSLTKKGARDAGVSQDLVGRGVITGKDKVSAKMGMNFGKDQCGRKNIDGTDIDAKYKCSDYKERYAEHLIDPDASVSIKDVIEAAEMSDNGLEEDLEGACAPLRTKWLTGLLRSLNSIALAQKGDLIPKPKENLEQHGQRPDNQKKSIDAKRRAKTKKIRSAVRMGAVPKGGFSRSERDLLSTNSLWENFLAENTTDK